LFTLTRDNCCGRTADDVGLKRDIMGAWLGHLAGRILVTGVPRGAILGLAMGKRTWALVAPGLVMRTFNRELGAWPRAAGGAQAWGTAARIAGAGGGVKALGISCLRVWISLSLAIIWAASYKSITGCLKLIRPKEKGLNTEEYNKIYQLTRKEMIPHQLSVNWCLPKRLV
jgi:hypothetical protein